MMRYLVKQSDGAFASKGLKRGTVIRLGRSPDGVLKGNAIWMYEGSTSFSVSGAVFGENVD